MLCSSYNHHVSGLFPMFIGLDIEGVVSRPLVFNVYTIYLLSRLHISDIVSS